MLVMLEQKINSVVKCFSKKSPGEVTRYRGEPGAPPNTSQGEAWVCRETEALPQANQRPVHEPHTLHFGVHKVQPPGDYKRLRIQPLLQSTLSPTLPPQNSQEMKVGGGVLQRGWGRGQ